MKKNLITTLLLLAIASLGMAFPRSVKAPSKLSAPSKVPVSSASEPATATPSASTAIPSAAPTTPVSAVPSLNSPEGFIAGLDISSQCTKAILSIATSPEFLKCIPIAAFLPLIPIVSDPDFLNKLKSDPAGTFKKVEPVFVQFSKGFCPAPKCSDKGVAGAVQILSEGCKTDLQKNTVIQLLFGVAVFYSPIHDNVCFEDEKTKKFCWDESLTTIFSLPKSPIKIIDGGLIDSIAVADPFEICTRCNKDMVNTVENFLKDNKLALQVLGSIGITQKQLDLASVGIAVKCGIKFEDGRVPDKP